MNTKDKLEELKSAARDAYEACLSATRSTYNAKEVARNIFDDAETITHEPSKAYTTAAHNAALRVYNAARAAYDSARTAQGAALDALDALDALYAIDANDALDAAKNLNN